MKIPPHIFREYDVRGVVDKDLSEDFAYLLGRAYASLAKENNKNNIAVGHDCRLSSPPYAQALCRGLADEGVDSCLIGMGPTPQVYYSLFTHDFGGGIQVTGSHNPPDMNGFKICLGQQTLSGPQIQDLRDRCERLVDSPPSSPGGGKIGEKNIMQQYIDELAENCRPHMGNRKLKVVVDAGNGVAGMVGPEVLKKLGVEVIELYCEPDGNFPNHHPDPTVLDYIGDLIAKVKETGADFGVGWDGDGDRIGLVDENGNVIFGDMLLLIYAREVLKAVPGSLIIGDVKCSSQLFDDIKAKGGEPIMWKTGHSLIKNKLKESGGALGGEMSGHIFFKHRFYGFDDAQYCAARFAEIVSNTDTPVSQLLSDLPKTVSTPEIRVDCPEDIKFKVVEKAQGAFSEYHVDTIDGARIRFDNGWGLIRASNTQPVLVMRFEATNDQDLKEYQALVTDRVEKIKREL